MDFTAIDLTAIVSAIGYIFIVLGIIGAVVPVLPGPLFIWLGTFIWAWGDGFVRIGWPLLLFLAVLTIVAWVADLLLTTVSSRRAGVGWRSIGIGILGGLAGAVALSFIPLLGTLLGAVAGSILALWYSEYQEKGDREAATTAVKAYIQGFALSFLIEAGISFFMVGIFAWRVLG